LVVYVSPDGLRMLEAASFDMGRAGGGIRAIFLPLATWLIVLALAVPGWKRPNAPKLLESRDIPVRRNGLQSALKGTDKTIIAECRHDECRFARPARRSWRIGLGR
jgi:hypothetical protein